MSAIDTTANSLIGEVVTSHEFPLIGQLELDVLHQENIALKKILGDVSTRSRRENYDNNATIEKQLREIEKLEIEVNALRVALLGK